MKRIFWVGIGVTIGVLATRKVSQVRTSFVDRTVGPEGLNRAVGALADSLGDFAGTVKASMAEREAQLRAGLGLDADSGQHSQQQRKGKA